MDIIDLDDNIRQWSLKGYVSKATATNKSSYHIAARKMLHKMYPTLQILEEVSIPINRKETLFLDFYIPISKKCIEVHGEQHYKFVPFYHTNKLSFLRAQKKDKQKEQWCEKNLIKYIALPYNLSVEEWEELLNEY